MTGPLDPAGAGWPPGPATRFQPLPGAQLVDAWRARGRGALDPGEGIEVVAPEGTPVHAVAGGDVVEVVAEGAEGPGGRVAIRGEDGCRYDYRRLASGSVTVAPGQRVAAGSILGAVGPAGGHGLAGHHGPTHLLLAVTGPGGEPLDPYQLLLGLPDPNELGYGPSGLGRDIDPDETDRQTLA